MRGLDHVVHVVRDLAATRRRFSELGFTTTPPALHPWGTGNTLIQLEGSFIEVLGIEQPHNIARGGWGEFSFGHFNQQFLARGEGMSMLVFNSEDAAADLAWWREQGLTTYAPFDFSRTATLPDGGQVRVAFSLAFVTHPEAPWAAWFVCQQYYPEHFWKPEYQRHENGAKRMDRVWMVASRPARFADFLARLFPDGRVEREDDACTLVLPRGRFTLETPRRLAARFPWLLMPEPGDGPRFVATSLCRDATGSPAMRQQVAGLGIEMP